MNLDSNAVSLREKTQFQETVDRSALRVSEARRQNLQTYARLLSNSNVELSFDEELGTADVNQTVSPPEIRITASRFAQQTAYEPRIFDYLIQYGLAVHEVGHLLYTDHGALTTCLSSVPSTWTEAARIFWNIYEDGAIEEALRREFGDRVTQLLAVTNANLRGGFPENASRISPAGSTYNSDSEDDIEFLDAIYIASLDLAVWDSGRLESLLSSSGSAGDILDQDIYDCLQSWIPRLKTLAVTVRTTPDPIARTNAIFDVWSDLQEDLQNHEEGAPDKISSGDSGTEDDDDVESKPDENGKPDDSRTQMGEGQFAPGLADSEQDEVLAGIERTLGEVASDNTDSVDSTGNGVHLDASELPSPDDTAVKQAQDRTIAEQSELDQAARDQAVDADAYQEIVENAPDRHPMFGGPESGNILYLPETTNTDSDSWSKAINAGKPLIPILNEKLRRERRSSIRRGQRRGTLDTRRLSELVAFGEQRVFEQRVAPDQKDYGCLVILDRSGSMSGPPLRAAEEAVGGFLYALSQLGISLEILDILNGDLRIVGTKEQSPRSVVDSVFDNSASGGTPLTSALYLARKRVVQYAKQPFVIIITDGHAQDLESYHHELRECQFPVLGVLVEQYGGKDDVLDDQRNCYHQSMTVSPSESIPQALLTLVQNSVF